MKKITKPDKQTNRFWKHFLHLKHTAPLVFYVIFLLLSVEAFMVTIAPMVIPDHIYLYLYLYDKSRKKTENFLNNQTTFLMRDKIVGWRNRPDSKYGKWRTDTFGSRSTHFFTTGPKKPIRVLFLGSSLVNGGSFISNNETISAFLEDSNIEAINFGTMLYSFDQNYLAYRNELYKYNANIVVIGLSADPLAGLSAQYIPFFRKKETNMPYIKPRFVLNSGKLKLLPVPNIQLHKNFLTNSNLLKLLKKTCGYYDNFEAFKRYGLMPVSHSINFLFKKAFHLKDMIFGSFENLPLLETLMKKMIVEAREKKNALVFFMLLPDRITLEPGWRNFFPDRYEQLLKKLRAKGFNVLDTRSALAKSGYSPSELYYKDNIHYSSIGNKVISKALKERIYFSLEKGKANP